MKRTLIILLILSVVIGLGVGGYTFLSPKEYDVSEDPNISEILTIETDTIIATVNAAGRLEAVNVAQAVFEGSGQVQIVNVAEGDVVAAGVVLAELDATDLAYALKLAEIEVQQAAAQLEKLRRPPAESDINAAQASLESANIALAELVAERPAADIRAAEAALDSAAANLQKVISGPNADSITVAAANLRKTEIALRQAQAAYDAVAYDARAAAAVGGQLEQATIDHEAALANFRLTVQEADNAEILSAQAQVTTAESNLEKLYLGATPSQIAAAQAQIVQAEANLQKLLAGPDEVDLKLAEMNLETAKIRQEQARSNLARTKLISSIAGTATGVNIKVGDMLNPNFIAVEITDLSALKLVVTIDEIDIGRVALGQPVEIILDALPEETFSGRVDEIGLTPVDGSGGGIVAFPVTITFDQIDDALKIGLNASVTIETERLAEVVVVPNRAIELDRETGQTFVTKLVDDQTLERTEIELGRRGNEISQVLTGLATGDQIVIRQRDRREELRRAIQGGE